MEQTQQVFFSIKRTADSIDGQIINYLGTEPFGLGKLPEIVMLTLKQHWSPFAIAADGVDKEVLRQRAIWSIKQLEAQAALIREVFLESAVVNDAVVTNSADEVKPISTGDDPSGDEEDEEDDGLLNFEPSEEMKEVHKFFGVE